MSGPSVHQHAFPKKRFQAAVVAAIDQHAAAIGQLADRVDAQGGVLADLAVDRDAAKSKLDALELRANSVTDLFIEIRQRGAFGRLRWLLTGK